MIHDDEFSGLDRAKYRLVHDHPGGARALGPLVGINPATLCNKVNPLMDTHHLMVDEAVRIQAVRRRFDVLHAEAHALGHVVVQVSDHSETSDLALLDAYAAYHADVGQTALAIRDALANGKGITKQCLEHIERELYQDATAGFEFLARLKAIVEDK